MATEHLLEPQLRQLVKHCIEQKLLSIGSFLETGHVKQTQFRAWRNRDVPSGSAVKAARQRCDEYFANNALPAQFAAQDAQAEDAAQDNNGVVEDNDGVAEDNNGVVEDNNGVVEDNHDEANDTGEEDENGPELPDVPQEPPAAPAVAVQPDDNVVESETATADKQTSEKEADSKPVCATYRFCSWNLRNIGTGTKPERIKNISAVLRKFDIIAVQEVRSDEFHKHMVDKIKNIDLQHLSWIQTQQYGDKRTEAQGFWYNPKLLTKVRQETLESVVMAYKPLLVTFQCELTKHKFTIVNAHISFGDKKNLQTRRDEVRALSTVFLALHAQPSKYGELLLCGDFNLQPSDDAFQLLRTTAHYQAVNVKEATNVATAGKLYDNIWAATSSSLVAFESMAVETFPSELKPAVASTYKTFRKEVSDHLPLTVDLIARN